MEIANKPENLIQLTAAEQLTRKSMKTLISLAESERAPIYATLGIGSGAPAIPIAIGTFKGASARLAIRHRKFTADERGLEVSNIPKGVRQVAQPILIQGNHFIQIHPDSFPELREASGHGQIQIDYVLLSLNFWEPKPKAEVERLLEGSTPEDSEELLFWFYLKPVTVEFSNLFIPRVFSDQWIKKYSSTDQQHTNNKKRRPTTQKQIAGINKNITSNQTVDPLNKVLIAIVRDNEGITAGEVFLKIKNQMTRKVRQYDDDAILLQISNDQSTKFIWKNGNKEKSCTKESLANRLTKLRKNGLIK